MKLKKCGTLDCKGFVETSSSLPRFSDLEVLSGNGEGWGFDFGCFSARSEKAEGDGSGIMDGAGHLTLDGNGNGFWVGIGTQTGSG